MSALDPSLNFAHENPSGRMCETSALLPEDGYCDREFIKWTRSRFGTLHWRAFYTEPVDDLSFAVSFHSSPEAGPPSREQLPLHALLFENLERAVRLAARPPDFAADDSALIAADAKGRALSLSERAEHLLSEGDGLLLNGGFLTAQSPEAASQLQRAFRAAVDPSSFDRRPRGVRISRSNGKPDLFVVVSRFPPGLDHLPGPTAATLVRLVELEMRPEHLCEHSHLFDLTPRETEVASALLEGHSINSMSETLGMSPNTARNHVQALFQKTRTNRQADLIRILDRLARQ
jgi:DNA-binding CsgD family transcriptional regulator